MNIETCYSPKLIHEYNLDSKIVIVVDVFRATSCIVAGFAAGVPHIIPVANKEECLTYKEMGYLLAGERNGEAIPGFDLGNSPLAFIKASEKRQPICMTTTNGTKAINFSKAAKTVIIGSFLNLDAITTYIKNKKEDIIILCAGWKGKYSLEDSLFAGALVNDSISLNSTICDASLAAKMMYNTVQSDILSFLQSSSHAKRLAGLNKKDKNNTIAGDIKFCCIENKFDVIPILKKNKLILL